MELGGARKNRKNHIFHLQVRLRSPRGPRGRRIAPGRSFRRPLAISNSDPKASQSHSPAQGCQPDAQNAFQMSFEGSF